MNKNMKKIIKGLAIVGLMMTMTLTAFAAGKAWKGRPVFNNSMEKLENVGVNIDKLKDRIGDNDELKDIIEDLEDEIAELEKDEGNKDSEIDELNDQLDQAYEDMKKIESEADELLKMSETN